MYRQGEILQTIPAIPFSHHKTDNYVRNVSSYANL